MKLLASAFQKKMVSRSSEITRGQKSRKKGQISLFSKSRQIIPQNEARDERFSKKLVSKSKKVIKGQKSRKKS